MVIFLFVLIGEYMLQYDNDKIIEELNILKRPDLAQKVINIAQLLKEGKISIGMRNEVKSILTSLFGKPYEKSISIPYEFLETITGEILFSAFYNLEQYVTISDIMKMTGYTRQWIWQCIKSGKLKGGAKFGRDYIFPSSAVADLN